MFSIIPHSRELQSVCTEGWYILLQMDLQRSKTQMKAGLWRCVKCALACQGRAMAEASLVRILKTFLRLFNIHQKNLL